MRLNIYFFTILYFKIIFSFFNYNFSLEIVVCPTVVPTFFSCTDNISFCSPAVVIDDCNLPINLHV